MTKHTLPAETHDRAYTVFITSGFLALGIAIGGYLVAGLFVGALEPGFTTTNPGVEGWYHRLLGITLTYFAIALIGAYLLVQRVERVDKDRIDDTI